MTVAELKKLAGDKKLVIGTDRTIKELKKGNLKKVFLAKNCHANARADIENNAKQMKIEVSDLEITSEELGVIVKKPFSVSIIGLAK
jgi:large subunit ribosomal protein L30e